MKLTRYQPGIRVILSANSNVNKYGSSILLCFPACIGHCGTREQSEIKSMGRYFVWAVISFREIAYHHRIPRQVPTVAHVHYHRSLNAWYLWNLKNHCMYQWTRYHTIIEYQGESQPWHTCNIIAPWMQDVCESSKTIAFHGMEKRQKRSRARFMYYLVLFGGWNATLRTR